jgi:predicted ester cyclase
METAMKPSIALSLVCLLAFGSFAPLRAAAGEPSSSGGGAESLDMEKTLSRRGLMMWASGASDKPGDIFAENYVNHQESDAKGGVKSLNLDAWKKLVEENHRAFSNFQVQILMQIAEGDLVATRWRFTATQTGVYLDHPPTGKQASWTGVQIDRFENGKISESWVDWDKYRLFAELGFLK